MLFVHILDDSRGSDQSLKRLGFLVSLLGLSFGLLPELLFASVGSFPSFSIICFVT